MILLIPCCGESERFDNIKKQFIIHPNGLSLPLFSASGITRYAKRFFIFIKDDFYSNKLDKHYSNQEIILLDNPTQNQVQTIQLALYKILNSGVYGKTKIYIKDCDNYFETAATGNTIAIKKPPYHRNDLLNKSYSLVDNYGFVRWLKERDTYTDFMNVGGYGFNSAFDFLCYSNKKKYITEVAMAAINDGEVFTVGNVKNYIDYGTQLDWDAYLQTLKNTQ